MGHWGRCEKVYRSSTEWGSFWSSGVQSVEGNWRRVSVGLQWWVEKEQKRILSARKQITQGDSTLNLNWIMSVSSLTKIQSNFCWSILFLSATNSYICKPSSSAPMAGSLTHWKSGEVDCHVSWVKFPACKDVVPTKLVINPQSNYVVFYANSSSQDSQIIYYDGKYHQDFPTHDPCGRNAELDSTQTIIGQIFIR